MMPQETAIPIDIDSAVMAMLLCGMRHVGAGGPYRESGHPRKEEAREPHGPSRLLRRTARMSKKERRKVFSDD